MYVDDFLRKQSFPIELFSEAVAPQLLRKLHLYSAQQQDELWIVIVEYSSLDLFNDDVFQEGILYTSVPETSNRRIQLWVTHHCLPLHQGVKYIGYYTWILGFFTFIQLNNFLHSMHLSFLNGCNDFLVIVEVIELILKFEDAV